ncbi:MAG TPA: GTP cyclohydrolase II [Microbacteriaceae bacterium]|nr:GTP cyclohydrolase II [Microbacteriaceae bacterium]
MIAKIPQALDALRAGRPVIVADDENRENEGDVILAAQSASQKWLAWTVAHTSGYICAPMTNEIADRLELPVMVPANEDPRGTNYTVSVDAADRTSTGISASDRANTLRTLAAPGSTASSVRRPGHILPLRARDGGVRERGGHTEAAVELLRLAGLTPVAAICELVADDGEMMRLPDLVKLGAREGIPVVTIPALIDYLNARENRLAHDTTGNAPAKAAAASGATGYAVVTGAPVTPEGHLVEGTGAAGAPQATAEAATGDDALDTPRVTFQVATRIPTRHGPLTVRAYRDRATGADHLAIIAGTPGRQSLVRVHSECLTGEVLGSLKCECGPQLDASLDAIAREGGVVVYLRGHEGRGIGLINKLRAYRLQEDGLDTVDANVALGLPVDARDYGAAAAILADLGIESVRLLTNNPEKQRQLEAHGIRVAERVPLVIPAGPYNAGYLATKRDRMGHLLPADGEPGAAPTPNRAAHPAHTQTASVGDAEEAAPAGDAEAIPAGAASA